MPLRRIVFEWAHQDSNLGPTGYEPVALPAELWAPRVLLYDIPNKKVNLSPAWPHEKRVCATYHWHKPLTLHPDEANHQYPKNLCFVSLKAALYHLNC